MPLSFGDQVHKHGGGGGQEIEIGEMFGSARLASASAAASRSASAATSLPRSPNSPPAAASLLAGFRVADGPGVEQQ